MLNRIYIVVGLLAIIVLAGAFIVPRFVQWGDYRGRMEELASGVLGTPVSIRGEIEFALLPQPRLHFTDVLVGSPEEPAATVDNVEADFSLIDFLRDNYRVTRLVLQGPVVDFTVDESGFFGSGVSVAGAGGGVLLEEASIVDGTVRLMDRRSGENFVADHVDGQLRLTSFSGPFQFQGAASQRGTRYSVRFNSSAVDEVGNARFVASVAAADGGFSLTAEGAMATGMAPKFDGTLTFRQSPPLAEGADDIRGDLIFNSTMTASTDRIVLSGYTLQPDENRAAMRLTGAASIQLGARRNFDAVISGGVFALPPRDASEDASTLPLEAVRLLSELPAPIIPPLPGRVGIDLAEVGLRGFALRNLRVDASTDGKVWQIEQLIGQLPGQSELRASGTLLAQADRPDFRGTFTLNSQRLDALAQVWRRPSEDNPLFNEAGAFEGKLLLAGEALGVSGGLLTLAEHGHAVELRLGFGAEKRLDIVGKFDELGTRGSRILGALLPNAAEPSFGVSFPAGSFSLSGQSAHVFGQDGTDLVAEGQWSPEGLTVSRLAAAEWGGLGVDLALEAGGTLDEPNLSGEGRLTVAQADAPALATFYDLVEAPQAWRNYLAASVPANLAIALEAAGGGASQVLSLRGTLGAGDLNLRAQMAGGLTNLFSDTLQLTATLDSDDAAALTRQIGLGEAELFDQKSMLVSVGLEGVPVEGFESRINLSSGDSYIGYSGALTAGNEGQLQGSGTIDLRLADASGLADLGGASGAGLPPLEAKAQLSFAGLDRVQITDIEGRSGAGVVSGALSMRRTGDVPRIDGELAVDAVSVEGLAAALFGRAATAVEDGTWPTGPIDLGAASATQGAVAVTATNLLAADRARGGQTSFEFTWGDDEVRLARFTSAVGEGRIDLDLTVCCTGALSDKTVDGRVNLVDVTLDTLLPEQTATALDGTLSGVASLEGTGATVNDVVGALAGEGSFTIANLTVEQLAPGIFPAAAGFEDVLNMDPEALVIMLGQSLQQGSFTTPVATGTFTVAGGVARLANLIIEGQGVRLAGDLNLALRTLSLSGGFALTPRDFEDPEGIVASDTSRILTRVGGSLGQPEITVDVEEMAAAMQVRANELEVDRLEVLRAEDEARQRAAAEERNRLIEEQRRRAAEEARLLAEQEALRQAEEEAAQRAAEEEQIRLQQQLSQPPVPISSPSFQTLPPLTLPPGLTSVPAN